MARPRTQVMGFWEPKYKHLNGIRYLNPEYLGSGPSGPCLL